MTLLYAAAAAHSESQPTYISLGSHCSLGADADIVLQVIRWNPISSFLQSRLICLFVVGGPRQDPVHPWPLGPQPVVGPKTRGRRSVAPAGPTPPLHMDVLIQMSAKHPQYNKESRTYLQSLDLLTIAASATVGMCSVMVRPSGSPIQASS